MAHISDLAMSENLSGGVTERNGCEIGTVQRILLLELHSQAFRSHKLTGNLYVVCSMYEKRILRLHSLACKTETAQTTEITFQARRQVSMSDFVMVKCRFPVRKLSTL